ALAQGGVVELAGDVVLEDGLVEETLVLGGLADDLLEGVDLAVIIAHGIDRRARTMTEGGDDGVAQDFLASNHSQLLTPLRGALGASGTPQWMITRPGRPPPAPERCSSGIS